MLELNDSLWYGTEASFYQALAAESAIASRLQAGPFDADIQPDYLLTKVGKVGVVSIKGPLVNSDSPILAFFGVTGYPAIRRAMVAAAKDEEIEQILLSVDSGGGAVNGVADTADLILRINAGVKPVTTLADGTMASAAYWLGSSASERFATKTSVVGSIGILAIHLDRTKQLEQDGIKATVMRSGKFKALVNPFEPLTEAAKAGMQAQMDEAYRIFVTHIAAALQVPYAEVDKKMAQGREFMGQQAVDVGLVDKLSTLDAVISELSARKKVDKRRGRYDNGISYKGTSMAKAVLTEQDIAALASGAALAAGANEVELTEAQKVAKVAADAAAAEAVKVAADAARVAAEAEAARIVAEAAAAAEVARLAAEKTAADKAATEPGALVAFLQSEVKIKDAALTAQAIELNAAKASLAVAEATHSPMLEVVRTSISRLRVALGGAAGDVASLGAAEALVEHKRLSEEFNKKFKVGGLAAVATEKQIEAVKAGPLHAARVAAAKL